MGALSLEPGIPPLLRDFCLRLVELLYLVLDCPLGHDHFLRHILMFCFQLLQSLSSACLDLVQDGFELPLVDRIHPAKVLHSKLVHIVPAPQVLFKETKLCLASFFLQLILDAPRHISSLCLNKLFPISLNLLGQVDMIGVHVFSLLPLQSVIH